MPLSIDTYKPEVARTALAAGAHLLNDIYGFCRDPELARIAADAGTPAIVMHNQRLKRESSRSREVIDVADAISRGLRESMAIAGEAGLPASKLIADPGFGFGWTADQNIEMLRRLGELRALGLPLLVGTSRKSTIGSILGDVPVDQREFGTAATVALAIAGGADIVRVHDVTAMKQVALVADAILDVSRKDDIVLDAFAGSGTTVLAAEKTGRRARAIESDPRYCDGLVRRWQAYAAGVAVHEGSGLTFGDVMRQRHRPPQAAEGDAAGLSSNMQVC